MIIFENQLKDCDEENIDKVIIILLKNTMTKKELNKKSKNENINFNLISMKINMILLKKNMIKRKIIFFLNFHLYEYKNNNFSLINLLIEQLNYFFENLVKFFMKEIKELIY